MSGGEAPRLIVLAGPTASGKTTLACELAQRLDAEIVSADSQQCYRGLDVGTAKPTQEERALARHHLLDVAEPEEQLDAGAYVRLADAAIADLLARGKRALVVGGTGLWIRALVKGLLAAPGADPQVRERLRAEFERDGAPAVHARLAAIDPDAAAAIRPNDRVRIERALEVFELSGERLSVLQRAHRFSEQRYQALTFVLDPPRELLAGRITARTRAMFASGDLERETRMLLERGARKALKIIGYGECAEALEGRCTLAQAEERTLARTRQYAKRQRTWFARENRAVAWPPDAAGLCEAALQWYLSAG